ncbi:MAG: hypothetical protein K8I30_01410 [Anaerolineae bacterium]|nr:hypothetical protein [Anaerolineae bacterium]
MKRMFKNNGLLAMVIFFLLVIAGGAALVVSDNWENPFAAFSTSEGRPGEGFGPPERSTGDTSTAERPARGGEQGAQGLSWSAFGGVLYNIWYLFAAAGVIMLLGQPIRCMRRQMRRRNAQAAAPA